MSQWGTLDRKVLTGTANVENGNTYVIGTNADFISQAQVGYALLIANVAYKINQIPSGNSIILDVAYAGSTSTGLTVAVQQSPKDLTTNGWGANTTNKRNTYGVDRLEIANTLVKAKGINHTGWTTYRTYVDAHSQTRHKAETLVAMSKNFNANATAHLQTDANDDTVIPE